MGFLSKVWKGIKKTVKKIGKGIKKGIQKVGKFMDKIGIVGQIGLALVMPGIGSMLGQWAGAASTGFGSGLINAAKAVVNTAIDIGTRVSSVFSTVTEGVTSVLGEVAGATLKEIGLGDVVTEMGWNIKDKAFSNLGKVATEAFDATKATVGDLFSKPILTTTNKFAQEAATKAATQVADEAFQATMEGVDAPTEFTTESFTKGMEGQLSLATPEKPLFTAPEIKIPEIVTPTATPSLLDQGITALKDLPDNLRKEAAKKIKNAPKEILEYGTNLGKNIVTEKAYEVAGIDTTPDIDRRSYQTVVPGVQAIDFNSGVASNIGFISPMPSQQRLAQSPYGYGAALYNENTYAARMRALG